MTLSVSDVALRCTVKTRCPPAPGGVPSVAGALAVTEYREEVLIRTEAVLEPKLAVEISRSPSWSKSPITRPPGETPTAKGAPAAGVKEAAPLLMNTLTELLPELVDAISRSP